MEKILIVDDHPDIVSLFSALLRRKGYQVVEALNGLSAVESAIREKPRLIFMDIFMPSMNGFEAAKILKKHPATRYIPIVGVSGTDCREESKQSGFDHFVIKPLTMDQLYSLVEDYSVK